MEKYLSFKRITKFSITIFFAIHQDFQKKLCIFWVKSFISFYFDVVMPKELLKRSSKWRKWNFSFCHHPWKSFRKFHWNKYAIPIVGKCIPFCIYFPIWKSFLYYQYFSFVIVPCEVINKTQKRVTNIFHTKRELVLLCYKHNLLIIAFFQPNDCIYVSNHKTTKNSTIINNHKTSAL